MNRSIMQGKWNQIQGEVRRCWGKWTGSQRDVIDGNLDILVGKLQQRRGERREEIDHQVAEMIAVVDGPPGVRPRR